MERRAWTSDYERFPTANRDQSVTRICAAIVSTDVAREARRARRKSPASRCDRRPRILTTAKQRHRGSERTLPDRTTRRRRMAAALRPTARPGRPATRCHLAACGGQSSSCVFATSSPWWARLRRCCALRRAGRRRRRLLLTRSRLSSSASDTSLDLGLRQLGEHRQRQHARRCRLGRGKVARPVAERGAGLLKVRGHRDSGCRCRFAARAAAAEGRRARRVSITYRW